MCNCVCKVTESYIRAYPLFAKCTPRDVHMHGDGHSGNASLDEVVLEDLGSADDKRSGVADIGQGGHHRQVTNASTGQEWRLDLSSLGTEAKLLSNEYLDSSQGDTVWRIKWLEHQIWCLDMNHAASVYADYLFANNLPHRMLFRRDECNTDDAGYNKALLDRALAEGYSAYGDAGPVKTYIDSKNGSNVTMETVVDARIEDWVRVRVLAGHTSRLFRHALGTDPLAPIVGYFKRVMNLSEGADGGDAMYKYLYYNEGGAAGVILKTVTAMLYAKAAPYLVYELLGGRKQETPPKTEDALVAEAVQNMTDSIRNRPRSTNGTWSAPKVGATEDAMYPIERTKEAVSRAIVDGNQEYVIAELKTQVRGIHSGIRTVAEYISGGCGDYPDWVFVFCVATFSALQGIQNESCLDAVGEIVRMLFPCKGVLRRIISSASASVAGTPGKSVADAPGVRMVAAGLRREMEHELSDYATLDVCSAKISAMAPSVAPYVVTVAATPPNATAPIHPFVASVQSALVATDRGRRQIRMGEYRGSATFFDPVRVHVTPGEDLSAVELSRVAYHGLLRDAYGIRVDGRAASERRPAFARVANTASKCLNVMHAQSQRSNAIGSTLGAVPADQASGEPVDKTKIFTGGGGARGGSDRAHSLLQSDYPVAGRARSLASLYDTLQENAEESHVFDADLASGDDKGRWSATLVYAAFSRKPKERSYFICPGRDVVLSRVAIRSTGSAPGESRADHVIANVLVYSAIGDAQAYTNTRLWSSHACRLNGSYKTNAKIHPYDDMQTTGSGGCSVLVFVEQRVYGAGATPAGRGIRKTIGVADGSRPDDDALVRQACTIVRSTREYSAFFCAQGTDWHKISVYATIDRSNYFDDVLVYFRFDGPEVQNFCAAVFAHKSVVEDDSQDGLSAAGTPDPTNRDRLPAVGEPGKELVGASSLLDADIESKILPSVLTASGSVRWPQIWCADEKHAASEYADRLFGTTLLRKNFCERPVCKTGNEISDAAFQEKVRESRDVAYGEYGRSAVLQARIAADDKHIRGAVAGLLDIYIESYLRNERMRVLMCKLLLDENAEGNSNDSAGSDRAIERSFKMRLMVREYFERVLGVGAANSNATQGAEMCRYLYYNQFVANHVIFRVVAAALSAKVGPGLLHAHARDPDVANAVYSDLVDRTIRGPANAPATRLSVDSTVGITFRPLAIKELRTHRGNAHGDVISTESAAKLEATLKTQVRTIYDSLGYIAQFLARQFSDEEGATKYTNERMFREYPDWVFAMCMVAIAALRVLGDKAGVALASAIAAHILTCSGVLGRLFSAPLTARPGHSTAAIIDNPNVRRLLHCVVGAEGDVKGTLGLAECGRIMAQSAPWAANYKVSVDNQGGDKLPRVHPFVLGVQAALVGAEKGTRYIRLGANVGNRLTFTDPVSVHIEPTGDIEELASISYRAYLKSLYNIDVRPNHADPTVARRDATADAISKLLSRASARAGGRRRRGRLLKRNIMPRVYMEGTSDASSASPFAANSPKYTEDDPLLKGAYPLDDRPRTLTLLYNCVEKASAPEDASHPNLRKAAVYASYNARPTEQCYYMAPGFDLLVSSVALRRTDAGAEYVKARVLAASTRGEKGYSSRLLWQSVTEAASEDAYKTTRQLGEDLPNAGAGKWNSFLFVADEVRVVDSPRYVASTVGARGHAPPDNRVLVNYAIGLVCKTDQFNLFLRANGGSDRNVNTAVTVNRGDYFDYALVYFQFSGPTVPNLCAALFVAATDQEV